jgi:type IV pilus assembly protein PilB
LGEALVRDRVITDDQLKRAVRIQKYLEQPKQLGAVLIELGYATKQNIADALSKHGHGLRLGDILLEQDLVTPENIQQAVALQQTRKMRIGEALVELGALTRRSLLQNLAHQAGAPYIEPAFNMVDPTVLSGVSPDYLTRLSFVPFSRSEEGKVTVVVTDLKSEATIEAITELYKEGFSLALGPEDAVMQTIEEYRHYRYETRGHDIQIEARADSIIQLIDHTIATAIEERASDIHIEPMSDIIRVRFRIDGVLVYKTDLPRDMLPRIVSRLKILAECNTTEHQRHQGGRIKYTLNNRDYDLRLSSYVTVHGECIVLRILNRQTGLMHIEELGMNPSMVDRYRRESLDLPTGVVLITGPTGSGKTTTLYSSLNYCNSVDIKIITAEDPVEFTIDGLIQCSIYEKVGRTFEATLKEMVRQDPDIIVLGEIRDKITAETAIQAALTGHKVYSTFHTEDTIGGLLRLIDMDIETFLISSTVISVVAQRLLRRICDHCKMAYLPSPQELELLGLTVQQVRDFDLKKGCGCKRCNYTGYFGRIGAYELLVLNEEVKDAILQKKTAHAIRQICVESAGLLGMREDGIAKVIRGWTTFEEVLRHTPRTFNMRPLPRILAMTQ